MDIVKALEIIRQTVDGLDPQVGRVYATLQYSPKPEDVITDFKFKDPVLGVTLKAFMISPGNGRESRSTTGKTGFSLSSQTFLIRGYCGLKLDAGAPDRVLEQDFQRIRTAMRALRTMEGNAYHEGSMDWTPITGDVLGDHKVLRKELAVVVIDPRET